MQSAEKVLSNIIKEQKNLRNSIIEIKKCIVDLRNTQKYIIELVGADVSLGLSRGDLFCGIILSAL